MQAVKTENQLETLLTGSHLCQARTILHKNFKKDKHSESEKGPKIQWYQ